MSFIQKPGTTASTRTTSTTSSSNRTSVFDSIREPSDVSKIASLHPSVKKPCAIGNCILKKGKPEQPEEGIDHRYDHIVEVFDVWSEEDMRTTLQSEPFMARVYRKLAVAAGLMRPLNEQDYKDGLKEFNGNKEEFDAKFFSNKVEKTNTGYQLHSTELPFDAHELFKDATLRFLLVSAMLYFVLLSIIFTTWGWASECFAVDLHLSNAIPLGFLLLSGVGDQVLSENNSTSCLWMNALAVLIGVYVSLPVFGAVVLVRLLDNRADAIKTSDTVILTKRNGVPSLHFRALSGSGRALTNFSAHLQAWTMEYDEEMEENFFTFHELTIAYYQVLGYFPNLMKHVCDENSPLIQHGLVTVDEYGLPRFDRERLVAIQLNCNADGARAHSKQYSQNPTIFIEPDENGRLPFFENSTPVNAFHWKKYLGKVSGINDMSKLSSYKYNEKELRRKEA